MRFYDSKATDAFENLNSCEKGLTKAQAEERLLRDGKNELKEGKKRPLILKFFDQFKDLMIVVLLVAAVISAAIAIIEGKYADLIDSGIILLIVLVNAVIGLSQEAKAEAALEALKNMNKPFCKVLRDGELVKI